MSQQKVFIIFAVVAVAFIGMVSSQGPSDCAAMVAQAGEKYRQDMTAAISKLTSGMTSAGMNSVPTEQLTQELSELTSTASSLGNTSQMFNVANTMSTIQQLFRIQVRIGTLLFNPNTPLSMWKLYSQFLGTLTSLNTNLMGNIPAACVPQTY